MRPVKGLNPGPGNDEKNGGIEPRSGPVNAPTIINVKVTHGPNQYEVALPSDSTFGNLKSAIAQTIGSKPELHKLLFRRKEKEDDENLQAAGVKENSKVLLKDDMTCEEKIPEEVNETKAISIGDAAVAEVRVEVDKLSEQVSALQVVVDGGTKIDDTDIMFLTEMLMRQLLKLDGIEAEGEGKVRRKLEVRRIQRLVDTMDILKSRNMNAGNDNNTESVTTPWETFDHASENSDVPPPPPPSTSTPPPPSTSTPPPPPPPPSSVPLPSSSSSPQSTQPSIARPTPPSTTYPQMSSSPSPAAYSTHYPKPHPTHYPDQYPSHYPETYPAHYLNPYPTNYLEPYLASHPELYSTPSAVPYSAPFYVPYSSHSPSPYPAPYPMAYSSSTAAALYPYSYAAPQPTPYPTVPYPPPNSVTHSDPSHLPSSSTKTTKNWEHFD